MKSAILTLFYQNYNYGGILQGYALQQELKKLGVDSEILNLDRKSLSGFSEKSPSKKQSIFKRLMFKVNSVISNIFLRERRKAYHVFIKNHVKCSNGVYTDANIMSANEGYDFFITGSDQVWSEVSGRDATFLKFVEDNCKKCAYAASIGSDQVSDEYLRYMSEAIQSFSYISVREKKAANILQASVNNDVFVVLDPVFFVSAAKWKSLIGSLQYSIGKEHGPYGLLYFLGDGKSVKNTATNVCKKLNLDSLMIPYGKMKLNLSDMCVHSKKVIDAGPMEFIQLINEADYIFTDSYHCIAFSIILNKPFVFFGRTDKNRQVTMNSRIDNLLEVFSLENQCASSSDSIDKIAELLCREIDWEKINDKISEKRTEGERFLQNAVRTKNE